MAATSVRAPAPYPGDAPRRAPSRRSPSRRSLRSLLRIAPQDDTTRRAPGFRRGLSFTACEGCGLELQSETDVGTGLGAVRRGVLLVLVIRSEVAEVDEDRRLRTERE